MVRRGAVGRSQPARRLSGAAWSALGLLIFLTSGAAIVATASMLALHVS